MLRNWIIIFLYNCKNNPFFTILNVLGLSLGAAGLIFAMLYWNDENAYNTWNPERNRVYQVVNDLNEVGGSFEYWSTSPIPLGPELIENPIVNEYCYADDYYEDEILSYEGKKEIVKIMSAQPNFFSFFPFKFVKGTPNAALRDNTCIAIATSTAAKLFGDEDPLNKQLQYGDKLLTVRGVYELPQQSSYKPEAVTRLSRSVMEDYKENWGMFSFSLFLKIQDRAKLGMVEDSMKKLYYKKITVPSAKMDGISTDEYVEKYGEIRPFLESLAKARLYSVTDGYPEGRGNLQMLLIIVGLSVLILVLAIINYINLATANAVKRAKEVGVRKIVGASKSSIIWQFVFETAIQVGLAVLLALVIVEVALPFYNEFLDKALVLSTSEFYVQLMIVIVLLILLAGFLPALYVANFEAGKVLRGNFGRSKSGVWIRNIMLVFQFAIASFFIVGSYVVYSQVNYMNNLDLGFSGKQVLTIDYRNQYNYNEEGFQKKLHDRFMLIKTQLGKIDGVQQVSAGSFSFENGANSSSGFEYKGIPIQAGNMGIDFDLMDMMQIKIKEGRMLSPKIASDTVSSVLINETLAKMMNEQEVLGKEIDWRGEKKLNVVGVVKDFHVQGPQSEITPMIFVNFKTVKWMIQNVHDVYIKIDASKTNSILPEIESFWVDNIDADYPFSYDFVDKKFARTYKQYSSQKDLFSVLNVVVVLIALFGLFALASYSIERRMKEIAIRKTLGAATVNLLASLSWQYVVYCIIGFVIAVLPVQYMLTLWLENFAFRITISMVPFVIGFIILLSLTLLIVLSRVYIAIQADILKYLKYE